MAERVLIQDTVSGVTISGNIGNGNLSKTNIDYRAVLEPYVDDYSDLKVSLGPLDNLTITTINIDYPPDPDSAVLIDINDGSNHYEIGLYSGYSEIGVANPTGTPLLENGWELKFYVEESEEEKFLDKMGLTHAWNKLKTYFQDKLVSGTNIKTINNESLLGSGDITIQSGGSSVFIATYGTTTYQEVVDAINASKAIFIMIDVNGQQTLVQATSYSVFSNCVQFGMYSVNGEWGVICIYSDNTWDYDWQFTSLATVDQLPTIEVQGDWHYRIYNDGSFEAWYGKDKVSITVTNSSGSLYRSNLLNLVLPTNLTNQGTTEIVAYTIGAGHNNYPVWATVASKTATQINYYVLSGGSRNASPNYIVNAYVYGFLTQE